MKNLLKKSLAVLLALLCTMNFAVISFAEDEGAAELSGTCGENLTWEFDKATGTLTISGEGKMDDYLYEGNAPWYDTDKSITSVLIEPGATSIGDYAFCSYSSELKDVSIPDTIVNIGDYAFSKNTALTEASIPSSVETIGNYVFSECTSLTEVTIEKGVTEIGNYAFLDCSSLAMITLPDSIIRIGNYAFENCTNLVNFTIPDSVTSLGSDICSNSGYSNNSANWDEMGALYNGKYLLDSKNVAYDGKIVIKEGTVCIAKYGCSAWYLDSIEIPSSVRYICDYAFSGCAGVYADENNPYFTNSGLGLLNKDMTEYLYYNFRNVTMEAGIPASVTKIRKGAFSGTAITGISVLGNLEIIEDNAFSNCKYLESINLPDSLKEIGNSAFAYCEKLDLTLPNNITSIGESAFDCCRGIKSITIPGTVTEISSNAFNYCSNLSDITISEGVKTIGNGAFEGCPIKTIDLPDSLEVIEYKAFKGCSSLENIYIPDSVKRIEYGAFLNCSALESVEIGNGDTEIESSAFSGCESLTDLTIGNGNPVIGYGAFDGCTNLAKISIGDGRPEIENDAFNETAYFNDPLNWDDGVLYIGKHLITTKEKALDGSYLIKEDTITIGANAFEFQYKLKSVSVPDSVKYIGENAFGSCRLLESVSLGKGLSEIGGDVFYNCGNLKNITVDSENESFFTDEQGVLYNAEKTTIVAFPCKKGITHYTIPATVTEVYGPELSFATELKTINVEPGNDIFSSDTHGVLYNADKTALLHYPVSNETEKFVIPDSVEVLENDAFFGRKNLKEIVIPCDVEGLNFSFCKNLKTVKIGADVGSHCEGFDESFSLAFAGCDNLDTIMVDEDNPYLSVDENGVLYNKDKTALIYAPANCVGDAFVIPNTVKEVSLAFIDCEDFSLTIPNSVEDTAFIYYTSANEYIVSDTHPYLKSIDGVLYAYGTDENGNEVMALAKYPVSSDRKVFVVPENVGAVESMAFTNYTAYAFLPYNPGMIETENIKTINVPDSLSVHVTSPEIESIMTLGPDHIYFSDETLVESYNELAQQQKISMEKELETLTNKYAENDAYYQVVKDQLNRQIDSIPNYVTCNGDHTQTHQYTSTTTEATCKAEGIITYTCLCGDTYTESIPKKAHSWGSWKVIKKPTNKLEGLQQRTCSACGETENGTIPVNGYSLGEETYSFTNYSDLHWNTWLLSWESGHCFGMSVTSSAYYLDLLNVSDVGITECSKLNDVTRRSAKSNICKYQDIQGSYANNAIVAGGRYEKSNSSSGALNSALDWKEVINYVKDGSHNNKGDLQVAYHYGKTRSGHAVNFIDYRVVNGQERIYVYDNNFPKDANAYFYFENGKIYSYAGGTTEEVCSISLHDIRLYMQNAKGFTRSRTIYAKEGLISVSDAKEYRMLGETENSAVWCMYEIEDGVTSVTITPLTEDAAFVYMDEGYTFDGMEPGILKLSTTEDVDKSNEVWNPGLKLNSVTVNDVTLNYKNSAVIETFVDADEGVEYTKVYSSSNEKVATVDENGNITTHGRGTATVTCTVTDEYGNKVTDTCEVTVKYSFVQWLIVIVLFGWLWY